MRLLLPLLILGLVTLNGCYYDTIRGEDDHALFAEGEVVVGLGKEERTDPKRRVNTLSAGYIRTAGVSDQTLDYYDDIAVNGEDISGPVTLENDLKLSVGYLRFVRHMFVTQSFAWHWGAGLGYSHLNYTGTTPYQQVNFIDSATGLHGQAGVAYRFNPLVTLEGALGGYIFSGDYDSRLLTAQLGLAMFPVERLRLFAGYRRWEYYLSSDTYGMSDIDFLFAGPTVGASLTF
ncbi:MAG TPA: hypothetical protein VGE00_07685 [Gammaproteobacteria bacterium]